MVVEVGVRDCDVFCCVDELERGVSFGFVEAWVEGRRQLVRRSSLCCGNDWMRRLRDRSRRGLSILDSMLTIGFTYHVCQLLVEIARAVSKKCSRSLVTYELQLRHHLQPRPSES